MVLARCPITQIAFEGRTISPGFRSRHYRRRGWRMLPSPCVLPSASRQASRFRPKCGLAAGSLPSSQAGNFAGDLLLRGGRLREWQRDLRFPGPAQLLASFQHACFGLVKTAIHALALDCVAGTAAGHQILRIFLPLRARGITKSTDMIKPFSKLAFPSSPQYWQRY